MCGILYAKLKSPSIDHLKFTSSFSDALNLMNYRGPDSFNSVKIGNHFFGHVRLSIIDLQNTSNQPIEDQDHLMIFNGEIYNYKEIDSNSTSDTRTLFQCLKNMENPFSKVRGMFAFGWYEKNNDVASFYRDFFGEKPLYYYSNDDVDIVSSTLKSIKCLVEAIGKRLSLNLEAVNTDYLHFGCIREPKTIWNEVKALPPGHKMKFRGDTVEIESLTFNLDGENADWEKSYYLKQSLDSTDVPGALLLSEGVDSTMVLAAAARFQKHLRLAIYKAKSSVIDESEGALLNIQKLGLKTSDFPVTILTDEGEDGVDIEEFVNILEQPTSDGMQLYYLLRHLRIKHPELKLVYTGLGGDEMFGGYPTYYNFKNISLLVHIPFIDRLIPSMKRFKYGFKMEGVWSAELYAFLYRFDYNLFEKSGNSQDFKKSFLSYKNSITHVPRETQINRSQEDQFVIKKAETFDYCRNQLLRDNDNIAMHLGFESRSPLLNPDLYMQTPDKKDKLKTFLKEKFNINFGKKKGFTLDEYALKEEYLELLSYNNILLEKYTPSLTNRLLKTLSVKKLRSIVVLILWLKTNAE